MSASKFVVHKLRKLMSSSDVNWENVDKVAEEFDDMKRILQHKGGAEGY